MSVTFHYVGQTMEAVIGKIPSPVVFPTDGVWTVLWEDGGIRYGVDMEYGQSKPNQGILRVDQPDNLDILGSRRGPDSRKIKNGQSELAHLLSA